MPKPSALLGQVLLYGAFALAVGIFSAWPPYRHMAPDQALLKLSFSHHGERASECRQRTAEELAKLPPNMRAPMDCARERSPVRIELDLDGKPLYREVIAPSGLARDGASTVYRRFPVSAGEHRLTARLKDNARTPGFDYERAATLRLAPAQIVVVDFNAEKGGLVFQ